MTDEARPTRFGIALPQTAPAGTTVGQATAGFARAAQDSGLHSLWVQEQLLGRDPSIEPVVHLAHAAAATSTILLGTAVVVVPVRNLVVLAKQLASVDILSGGRLVAGLGLGDMPALFSASNTPLAGRADHLERFVALARSAWADGRIGWSEDGTAHESPMTPATVRRPHPPLWFGGRSSAAVDRARTLGSGWIGAGGSTTARFAELAAYARRPAAGTDFTGTGFTVAKKVYLAVAPDRADAWNGLLDWFVRHWGRADAADLGRSVAVAGTPQDCARGLAAVADAGADLIILNPVHDERRQLDTLVDDVLPRVPDHRTEHA